ncbi:MAG: ABC transporter ATP-binding protein [Rhizobiales bacterium PAR1]|nr:MAG: ABC transporter ATP-binding protein [Rhizobiales bacterium PAR1]
MAQAAQQTQPDTPGREAEDYVLVADGISKQFGGFKAVDTVTLKVRRGSIHALIGPNGAGKTTCFNLLTKTLSLTSGSIVLNGRDISHLTSSQVARCGLVRSFQISAIFPKMTVLENMRVALQRKAGRSYRFWQPLSTIASLDAEAKHLLSRVQLADSHDTLAGTLSYGKKRALEIVTTLALNPEVMLLDEPTAGMGHEDIEPITELIRDSAKGRTVLMVEHNMSIVAGICDRITVLQHGKTLAEGSYEAISADERVISAYIGGNA